MDRFRAAPLPLLLVALVPIACGDDGGDGGDASATATAGSSTAAATESSGAAASTSDAGSGSGASSSGGTTGGVDDAFEPLYGTPNVDDDDKNGKADWGEAVFAADDDIFDFTLPAWYLGLLAPGDKVEIAITGELDHVRLWRGDQVALGHTGDAPALALTLTAAEAGEPLQVEFGDFLRRATLTIRRLGAGGDELRVDEVTLLSAPMLVNHHVQDAEYAWAVQAPSNTSMLNTMKEVMGDRFFIVKNDDVWIQDELEWATATAPGERLNVAIDSIRDRPLDAFVKGLKGPDIQPMTWGIPGTQTTEDKFGNLEVTPPHSAGGVDYPFGRIYYGKGATCGPNDILTDHLDRQKVQRPLQINTCWLCVGHVDEFISFIPDPSSPKGFKFLIADVPAAYALLDALPGATKIPRYAQTHGYATIGALVGDDALRAQNQDIQSDFIDPVREQIKAELDLDESDIIRLPGLFETVNGCSYKQKGVAALIPGMLNLVVANFAGEPLRIFVSDPFMRPDGAAQQDDPLIANFEAALPPEYEIHFVDDWYTYHVAIGEVHCGTNVARKPDRDWWSTALHLIDAP